MEWGTMHANQLTRVKISISTIRIILLVAIWLFVFLLTITILVFITRGFSGTFLLCSISPRRVRGIHGVVRKHARDEFTTYPGRCLRESGYRIQHRNYVLYLLQQPHDYYCRSSSESDDLQYWWSTLECNVPLCDGVFYSTQITAVFFRYTCTVINMVTAKTMAIRGRQHVTKAQDREAYKMSNAAAAAHCCRGSMLGMKRGEHVVHHCSKMPTNHDMLRGTNAEIVAVYATIEDL